MKITTLIFQNQFMEKNQQHMVTLSNDFDNDGDIDLAIQYTRLDPFYGGNYIQILINDGQGNFSDTTSTILGNATKIRIKKVGFLIGNL